MPEVVTVNLMPHWTVIGRIPQPNHDRCTVMAFSGKMTMINTIVRAVNRNPFILRQVAWGVVVGYGTVCKTAMGSQP